jgi:hypothetical protein
MGMGIRQFYTQATQKDFSRDFQLRVLDLGGVLTQADNVYITTANLPGYAVTNQTVPFMGLVFNVPGSATFPGSENWAVTFRADMNLNIRQKLINWQSSIFNAFPNTTGQSTGNYAPKGIESTAILTVHDRDGNTVRGLRLIGVWPVSIEAVQYNQTGNGTPIELPVTLAYQWWEPYDVNGNVISDA